MTPPHNNSHNLDLAQPPVSRSHKHKFMASYYFLRDFINFCLDTNLSRHAKALSFSTVLAIIPLLVVGFGVLAASPWIGVAQEKVQQILLQNLFPAQIGKIFQDYVLTLIGASSKIQIVGFIFLTITIIFLFLDIEDSFNDIALTEGTKKESKIWYKRVLSIGSLFLIPLALVVFVALALTVFNATPEVLRDAFRTVVIFAHGLQIFLFVLLWAWLYFLYRVLPQRKMGRNTAIACSGIGAIIFVVAQIGFGFYLSSFSSYDVLYGVLAAIPIFLLWVLLNWQITLYPFAFAFFWEDRQNKKETVEQKQIAPVEQTTEANSEGIQANTSYIADAPVLEAGELGATASSTPSIKDAETDLGTKTEVPSADTR